MGSARARTAVVGYGSYLHGDDAVGPILAERVAAWGLPLVEAVSLTQLVPELVDLLAVVDRVVFADATQDGGRPEVRLSPLPERISAPIGHVSEPSGLLELCECLHGSRPRAWLLTIPAGCLEPGDALTETGERGVRSALAMLREFLDPDSDTGREESGW